jgi:hypothetical protein
VQAAEKACRRFDEEGQYTCAECHGTDSLDPDAYRQGCIWIDDMCLQTVYDAVGDLATCEQTYSAGVRPICCAYDAQPIVPLRRYTDSLLGFAVEVPSNWEIAGSTGTPDPLGHTWSSVEFRSELHAYGHQAFNQYGIRVQVGPSLGSTLTETVQLSLSVLPPGYREQVQMDCCLRVGNEQAMQLWHYPPTRWGNHQIVVLHKEREYRLDFFPLLGLTTTTPAGIEACAAFEAFLRTFSFIPITAKPSLPAPTVTPAPTPKLPH